MRHFPDWIKAFVDYASYGEAPKKMYAWVAVSTLAGALRRHIWIDQAYFKWHPNFYIFLVAPPGIVSKSTTAGVGMNLLRRVSAAKFGPDVVTWQALVTAFAESSESFLYNGDYHVMSPLTIESSELGNLLNPQDKEMVDLLVSLWDGRQAPFQKRTKGSGNDTVEGPWINILACTTPAWIAGNFPEYLVGGGLTSRCVFVYADTKARYVAYPGLQVPRDLGEVAGKLVADLEHISTAIIGEYQLAPEAVRWGEAWYKRHYENRPTHLDDDRFGGYIARKQTHIHKLAMVLAVSERDERVITLEDLVAADIMVTDLEADMPQVFAKIGKTTDSLQADRFINFVRRKSVVSYEEAYRYIHTYFPDVTDFEGIVAGAIRAGYMKLEVHMGTDGKGVNVLVALKT